MTAPPADGGSMTATVLRQLGDAEVIRRIADRRQDALAELYDRYGALLLGLARRILHDVADAEEVVQEVFVQVWTHADRYDRTRSSAATWLVLLTRSRAIDRLRSRQVRQRTARAAEKEPRREDHTSPEGPRAVWYRERQHRLREALAALPEEQRAVLEMSFFDGKTQREIAAETGIPLGTVKTRTLLAMKKLRSTLDGDLRELL